MLLDILPCRSSSLGFMKTRSVSLSGLGLAARRPFVDVCEEARLRLARKGFSRMSLLVVADESREVALPYP